MSTFPENNATVVDLTYEEALIQAFLRDENGMDIDQAEEMFPEVAHFIYDAGDGMAHIDEDLAYKCMLKVRKARRSRLQVTRHFPFLRRRIRRLLDTTLCLLPLVLGVGIAVSQFVATDNWADRVLGVMLGWFMTVIGYVVLVVACSLLRAKRSAPPAY